MSTAGRKLLSSLVQSGDMKAYMDMALEPHLFKDSENDLYEFIAGHISQFGVIPSPDTIEAIEGLSDALVDAPEPVDFYLAEVEKRYLHNSLKATVQEVSSLLTGKNAEMAFEVLMKHGNALYQKRERKHLFDFREAETLIYQEYAAIKKGTNDGIPFGWPTLDAMSGGMRGGDFITYVGRPMCLSGETEIWVSRKEDSSGRVYKLKDVHHRFHGGGIPTGRNGSRVRHWDRSIPTEINSLGNQGLTLLNTVNDVVYSGKKMTYTVTTSDGKTIRSTLEHQFLTPDGYKELKEIKVGDEVICRKEASESKGTQSRLTNPELTTKLEHSPYRTRVVSGIRYHRVSKARLAVDASMNGLETDDFVQELKTNPDHKLVFSNPKYHVHHKDRDRKNYSPSNLEVLSPKKHKVLHHKESNLRNHFGKYGVGPCKVVSIELYGEEDTYDICMNYPYNNFVAQDFVVHNSGKTFQLLYSAHNLWRHGGTPLFVSMEMLTLIITQRIAAMHAKKKLTDLMKAELSTTAFKAMMLSLKDAASAPTPLWVVDGSLMSTVNDLLMLCRQLKPSAVYVDGAYLLDHEDKRMSKWDKQAENARQLKQLIATDLGIPVVASYQLGKASAKAKKKSKGDEKEGMEDVYGSDEMAQLSSVMLGLFDDENDIEAKKRRRIRILKGRNGETGEFTINWDFSPKMDFTEYVKEDPATMQMDYMG